MTGSISLKSALANKKNTESSPRFKSASLDQIWSCLQRYLLFEEPSSRWSKLILQVSKLALAKNKDLSKIAFSAQQDHFVSVFGTPPEILDDSSRLFNLVLAIQDLRTFESSDFDLWFLSQENEETPETFSSTSSLQRLAQKVLGEEPSPAQIASLDHAIKAVPYWRILESNGPWSNNPLADFVVQMLSQIDRQIQARNVDALLVNPDLVLELDKTFRESALAFRAKLPASFQPDLLVLVEGSTELILLPRFLSLTNSRQKPGAAMFIACGGANQLLRKYVQLRDSCKLPILCVLDHDAAEQIDEIEQIMRECDYLHVWSAGEIEDTFAAPILLRDLNAYLNHVGVMDSLVLQDLLSKPRRTEVLDRLWRARGLGDFDKVGFANFQATTIKQIAEIPEEARNLMHTIKGMISKNAGSIDKNADR